MCVVCFLGISKVYPDPSGTKVVFVDEKSDAYLQNPVSSENTIHVQWNLSTKTLTITTVHANN